MRHFIVVTHAYMSKGIVSSLELIMGKQDNLSYYCAYVGDHPYQFELQKELDSYDETDEIVIFTDMFGGSVNNELMPLINKKKNVHLVTGTNLILLISIVLAPADEPIEDIICRNIEEAKSGIIYCNKMVNTDDEVSLDDF